MEKKYEIIIYWSSEEDRNTIQEMLHLLSIPGMRESIREGMETPIEKYSEELMW